MPTLRPAEITVTVLAALYALYEAELVRAVSGMPLRVDEAIASVLASGRFISLVLMTYWMLLSQSRAGRLVSPTVLLRHGSPIRAALVELWSAAALAARLVLQLTVVVAAVTAPSSILAGADAALASTPPLAPALALLALHALRLVFGLVAVHAVVVAARLLAPLWLTVVATLVIWALTAAGAAFPDRLPELLNIADAINQLGSSSPTIDAQLRSAATLAFMLALALGAITVLTVRIREAGLRWRELDGGTVHLIAVAAISLLAFAGSTNFVDGAEQAFIGYAGTLLHALVEIVVTIGYAWAVAGRLLPPQAERWHELAALRYGSRRAWALRVLRDEARRLATQTIALAAIILAAWLLVSARLGDAPTAALIALHLVTVLPAQLAVYVTIVLVPALFAPSRIAALTTLSLLIVLPPPGTIWAALPLHQAGLSQTFIDGPAGIVQTTSLLLGWLLALLLLLLLWLTWSDRRYLAGRAPRLGAAISTTAPAPDHVSAPPPRPTSEGNSRS